MDKPERDPNASGGYQLPGGPGSSGGHPRPAARRAIVLRGLPPYDGDDEPAEGPDLVPVRQTYQELEMTRRVDPGPEASQSQELPHWPASAVPRPVSPPAPAVAAEPEPAPPVPVPLPPRWDARDETVALPRPVSPARPAPAGEETEEVRIAPLVPAPRSPERHRPWLLSLAVAATVALIGAGVALVPLIGQGQAGTGEPSSAPEPPPGVALPPAEVPLVPASGAASASASPSASASASASPSPSPTASASASVPAAAAAPAPPPATGSPARPTGAAAPAGRVNSGGGNIAQGRAVGASSQEGAAWSASAAVDGDMTSRWSSQPGDPQWITVDLGELWQLNTVTLYWENAYATAYRVETSRDGVTWTGIYSTGSGGGGTVLIPAGGAPARYVRMTGTARVTHYGYSLFEIQVR
ncbi:hypothetical protein J2S43_004615 [Catenuloplanes nepalensis]|uniref:F5/8 type C domain-containing protein n=1 Tax=Catenuloplanes nepalensis TaxID=587533 RepID=A0ABT9MXD1_9ACTN|nr:discoidin domain-containing protein [Catenuloplanes nepalensis]MDP9796103.1 hypothetical protein [Catenuloplanes nepalensis]